MRCRTRGCDLLVQAPNEVINPHCPGHACAFRQCYKEKAPGHLLYCIPHAQMMQPPPPVVRPPPARGPAQPPRPIPRCEVEGCQNRRAGPYPWCEEHTCSLDRCHNETYDDDEQRCIEHIPCGEERCDRYRLRTRDGRGVEEYCERRKLPKNITASLLIASDWLTERRYCVCPP
jgi:hypothetical protein